MVPIARPLALFVPPRLIARSCIPSDQSTGWPRALRWPRLGGPAHRGDYSVVRVLCPPDEDLVSFPKTSLQCLDRLVWSRFRSCRSPARSERRPYKVQSDNLFRAASEKSQRAPMGPALFRSLDSCHSLQIVGLFSRVPRVHRHHDSTGHEAGFTVGNSRRGRL